MESTVDWWIPFTKVQSSSVKVSMLWRHHGHLTVYLEITWSCWRPKQAHVIPMYKCQIYAWKVNSTYFLFVVLLIRRQPIHKGNRPIIIIYIHPICRNAILNTNNSRWYIAASCEWFIWISVNTFDQRSKNISKLRDTGLCAGNSPVTAEFPAQKTSNAENVSIW